MKLYHLDDGTWVCEFELVDENGYHRDRVITGKFKHEVKRQALAEINANRDEVTKKRGKRECDPVKAKRMQDGSWRCIVTIPDPQGRRQKQEVYAETKSDAFLKAYALMREHGLSPGRTLNEERMAAMTEDPEFGSGKSLMTFLEVVLDGFPFWYNHNHH